MHRRRRPSGRWVWYPVALLAAAAVASASGSSCQRKKKRGAETEPRSAGVAVQGPPIKLLAEAVIERGAEPLALLRYRPLPTARYRFEKIASVTVRETIDAVHQPELALPAVTTELELSWVSPETGGLTTTATEPSIASGAERAAADFAESQLRRYRRLLSGRRGRIGVTARGMLGRVGAFDPPDSTGFASRLLAAALGDWVVVLPETPIGIGARWRVTRSVPRGASYVKTVASYALTGRSGGALEIDIELLTIGERQPITLPNLPAGGRAEMLALRVTATGKLTVDLASPTPIAGRLERSDVVHVRTSVGDRTLHDYYSESTGIIEVETRSR